MRMSTGTYNYRGKKSYFIIQNHNEDGSVTIMNEENFRLSKLNPNYIDTVDFNIEGDLIEKQYIRSGNRYSVAGISTTSSSGNTYYTNLTSRERMKKSRESYGGRESSLILFFAIIVIMGIIGGNL